jgi:hypothetical protein
MPLSRSLLRKTNSVPAIAAIVPNFLSPEHFYPFNEPWTKELVTSTSELDVKTGHLPIPTSLGLGLDLNMDVVREHPCDPNAYFDTSKPGWERRWGEQNGSRDRVHSQQEVRD